MNDPQKKAQALIEYLSARNDADAISKEKLTDASQLILHHEWGVALENLMEVLYEQEFQWDEKGLRIAEEAWLAAGLDWNIWKSLLKTGS